MEHTRSYDAWIGRTAFDAQGDKIGEIKDIYYDDVTGRPEWVAVKTGMMSGRSIVPINGATIREHADSDDCDLQFAYTKDQIKAAPDVDEDDDHLAVVDEQDLYNHYGFTHGDTTPTGTYGKNYGKLRPDLDYRSARYNRDQRMWEENQGDVIAEATAVNEQVTKTAQPETVRLRKYRWTEQVPVQREEVRVEGDTKTHRDVR